MNLLDVEELRTEFHTENGVVSAVDGIDLEIDKGEIVGLVGESGSGKSVTARSILRLIESPGEIVNGNIQFRDKDVLGMGDQNIRQLRGGEISMIFQDPMTAFNPTQTVGRQLHDVLRTHKDGTPGVVSRLLGRDHNDTYREQVIKTFERVGIPSPESRYSDYPHEFSGGMLQRAMIAMAIICEPNLILADEPTTSLDVTIEKQVLSVFRDLVTDMDTSVLWITHDLSVVANLCDRVVVMYAGKVMEEGPTDAVLSDPKNPYTQALLESIPRYDNPQKDLYAIEGTVPDPLALPDGCRFVDRCPHAHDRCYQRHPRMYDAGDQRAACYLLEDD